tara:strand:- start:98 stop:1471 length:1374 start_codon:yes stop_codon:yes gene_type:complete
MKKEVILSIFVVLILSSLISAINLDVNVNPISNAVITDIDEPAIFELSIINLEDTSTFEIYSLIGVDLLPKEPFTLQKGNIKKIQIKAMPQESIKSRKGYITFEYKIKNSLNEIQAEKLTINIIGLDEAISILPESINPKSEKITLNIKNRVNLDFDNIKISITSAFFDYESSIKLKALETKQIGIPLDKEKVKILNAGDYLLNTQIETKEKTVDIESIIKFLEQEDIEFTEINEGIIIRRQEISKNNLGNTKKTVKITAQRDLISYLFTSTNIKPTESKISGFKKQYTWEEELIPNEELKIIIKTNWFFPIIIILIIILLIILIKKSIETDLSLRKHVSFVKTKGGEFALKVSIRLRSKKFIEKINIIDKLPPLVKLYERYGAITPDKIDLNNRRLEWNVERLNEGEERIFTYIIYSKIGIVGRFELPETKAIYEKEGKIKRASSNRSFFINEPKD